MMKAWMLSQFYECPIHPVDDPEAGWDWPVCTAYALKHYCPQHPTTPDGWALVRVIVLNPQVEASRQDPRVIYCGQEYDIPPAKVLEVYAAQLDPNFTYTMMGQVIARLAQTEPAFYHELEIR